MAVILAVYADTFKLDTTPQKLFALIPWYEYATYAKLAYDFGLATVWAITKKIITTVLYCQDHQLVLMTVGQVCR